MKVQEVEAKSVASVERALAVMDAFREEDGLLSLAQIADRTQLYKSTILRLLETLELRGYVERNPEGLYHVGVKALRLAALYQEAVQPHDIILPVLRELVQMTRESASYNVISENARVCVYRVDSPQRIRDHIRPGDILPVNRGAAGRIFEAFANPSAANASVRRRMLAFTAGELDKDTAGVASPVFTSNGNLAGALAVSGPRNRFDSAAVNIIERLLLDASIRVTLRLGGDVHGLEAALAGFG